MKDLNKFLDENNIIKREEALTSETTDFDVRLAQFVDDPEPPPQPKVVEKPATKKTKKRQPKQVTKEKPELKTRRELIIEMIEKTRYQMLAKEVDYEVYQIMQQQHSENQKDRDIYQQNILNVRKDHKSLERKIEVLEKFLENEKNG